MANEFIAITADWTKHKHTLKEIRKTVFIDEQQVPIELEWDEFDEHCTHFLISISGEFIATGRLKSDGQIGRMAVLAQHRRNGAGTILLNHILNYAQEIKLNKVYCHAQLTALDFYKTAGFTPTGEIFIDANIPHQAMFKKLCY